MRVSVQVTGLREVIKTLRDIDAELPREVARALKERVAAPVAARIKAKVPVGPVRGGHWRDDIRASGTQKGAFIVWGRGDRVYPPLVEFVPKWGGRRKVGRYVQPEVDRAGTVASREVERIIAGVARRAGFD